MLDIAGSKIQWAPRTPNIECNMSSQNGPGRTVSFHSTRMAEYDGDSHFQVGECSLESSVDKEL